jgi:zinc protease
VPKSGPDWSKLPGPAEERPYLPPSVARRSLSNGIEVWVVRWDALPLVSASLAFPFGTADDPPGQAGLAELTAALLDQGTKRLNSVSFTEAVDALGASLETSADVDETVVSLSVTRRNAAALLELVGEMLREPRFDAVDFEREKAQQLARLQQGPTRPEWLAQRGFRKLLYGADHPYGRPGDGTTESVKGLTLDDVKKFAGMHYTPAHAKLVIAGDVEAAEVWSELERVLGDWKVQGAVPAARPAATAKAEPGVVYVVDKPGAVQSVIRVGRLWKQRTDPGYPATQLGNFVVGEDFRSRLNANLREKNGFTYGAGSRFNYRRDGSVWGVATSVRADATAPALREILKELKGVQTDHPLTDEELRTALAAVLREFPRAFATPGSLVGIVGELARYRLPEDELTTYPSRLRETKPEQVRAEFQELANPDGLFMLIVGDREKIEPELKKLAEVKEVRVLEVSR